MFFKISIFIFVYQANNVKLRNLKKLATKNLDYEQGATKTVF